MLLKSKIKELSHVAVQRRTEISRDKSYFVKSNSKSNKEYKQDEIIQM
jgi:hypothetical protein